MTSFCIYNFLIARSAFVRCEVLLQTTCRAEWLNINVCLVMLSRHIHLLTHLLPYFILTLVGNWMSKKRKENKDIVKVLTLRPEENKYIKNNCNLDGMWSHFILFCFRLNKQRHCYPLDLFYSCMKGYNHQEKYITETNSQPTQANCAKLQKMHYLNITPCYRKEYISSFASREI